MGALPHIAATSCHHEPMESSNEASGQEAPGCPMHAMHTQRTLLDADDELVFPKHKRVVTQYSSDESGVTELHLYYGEKEISFDDPELFAFGEGLAKRSRFVAGTATTWGEGYDWPRVRELLEQLLEEGVLRRLEGDESETRPTHWVCPSPLPPAQTMVPRTWFECEAITRELTGRPLELGYLELVIPIYRVAHVAMDAEGRQVGEANVFPKQLRLDVPTEWRTCPYAGSRYQDDLPMNVTALKSMKKHWTQTMVVLLRIRDAYLRRFPRARHGLTVGDLQRLSSLVLTVPAYLLMRAEKRVENGHLHPVLSSMFRVTDGVRMTMHRMLFTSANEPSLPPDAPMTSAEIYAYAERNTVFLSSHGVCAGPRAMIEEFLHVLVDGKPVEGAESVVLDAPVHAALEDLNPAFDYCLYGLQAYAVAFSLWPTMSRTYERLWTLVEAWSGDESETFIAFRERLQRSVRFLRTATRQNTEEQRVVHERAYADMYAQCAGGLGTPSSGAMLSERIAPTCAAHHAGATDRLRGVLQERFCGIAAADGPVLEGMVDTLMDYFRQEQAIVRAASEIQQRINHLLGRTLPTRSLTATDLALHYRLVAFHYKPQALQDIGGRLPYLVDELEEGLGLRIVVTQDTIEISDRTAV
jgi:hypothetical protein